MICENEKDNILGKRIILRKLQMDDAEDMFEYTSIPEVSKYLTWNAHVSVDEDLEYIKNVIEEESSTSVFWGIEVVKQKKIIGCIHIYNISQKHKRAEISYILSPFFAHNGYATEAVRLVIEWLFRRDFRRVQALCVEDNELSEKLMIRCGMSYEGTLHNFAVLKDNKSHSMKMYSICREE